MATAEKQENEGAPAAKQPIGLGPREIQDYYLKSGVLEKIFGLCQGREVIPNFGDKFGTRPSTIMFPGDLEFLVRQGTTSFHASVERWKNPLLLKPQARHSDLDKNRTAWDVIIDIDADPGLEYSKKAAMLIIQALKMHGVKNVSVKFSGRRGFHIGVHHKALPTIVNGRPVEQQFPEVLQAITAYVKENIRGRLIEQLRKIDPSLPENFDPYQIVHVEENWGSRHLFRMPYSFNEKTWLVSLPIELRRIASFTPEEARPEVVKPQLGFLDDFAEGEAKDLVMEAVEWRAKIIAAKDAEKVQREVSRLRPESAILEAYFAPCIQKILLGMKDGRKRGLFVLINFLRTVGWEWPDIEKRIAEWNQKNADPIPEVYIVSQISYAKRKAEIVPPPNCANNMYYKDIGVWTPECEKMKNPASWTLRRWRAELRQGRQKEI